MLCNHGTSEWPEGTFQTSRKLKPPHKKRVVSGSLESDTLVTLLFWPTPVFGYRVCRRSLLRHHIHALTPEH